MSEVSGVIKKYYGARYTGIKDNSGDFGSDQIRDVKIHPYLGKCDTRTVGTQTETGDVGSCENEEELFVFVDASDENEEECRDTFTDHAKSEPVEKEEPKDNFIDELATCSQVAKNSLDRLTNKLSFKLSQVPPKPPGVGRNKVVCTKSVATPTQACSRFEFPIASDSPRTPLATSTPRSNVVPRLRMSRIMEEEKKPLQQLQNASLNDSFNDSFNDDDSKFDTPVRKAPIASKKKTPKIDSVVQKVDVVVSQQITESQRMVTRSVSRMLSSQNTSIAVVVNQAATTTLLTQRRKSTRNMAIKKEQPVAPTAATKTVKPANVLPKAAAVDSFDDDVFIQIQKPTVANLKKVAPVDSFDDDVFIEAQKPAVAHLKKVAPVDSFEDDCIPNKPVSPRPKPEASKYLRPVAPVDSFDDFIGHISSKTGSKKIDLPSVQQGQTGTFVDVNNTLDGLPEILPELENPDMDDSFNIDISFDMGNPQVLARESIGVKKEVELAGNSVLRSNCQIVQEVPETPETANGVDGKIADAQTTPKSTRKRPLGSANSGTPAFKKIKSMMPNDSPKAVLSATSLFKKTKSFEPKSTTLDDFEDSFYDDSIFE